MTVVNFAFLHRTIHFPRRVFSCFTVASQKHAFREGAHPCNFDLVVVGGGIVGLATAREIKKRQSHLKMAVIEKECELATHASKRNSGVIHSGVYYKPGSKMAKFCVEGAEMMYEYCAVKNIPHEKRGKIIVATTATEISLLCDLFVRARNNKVPGIEILDSDCIKKMEPDCIGLRALYAPTSGAVDFSKVALSFAEDFQCDGGVILTGFNVEGFSSNFTGSECERRQYPLCLFGHERRVNTTYAVVCAGLYADRFAKKTGGKRDPMLVPIRGDFFKLKPTAQICIRHHIYPVPNPKLPFVGVHFTRRMDDSVYMGPNAILALSREGYRPWNFRCRDVWDMVTYPGFLQMSSRHWKAGIRAVARCMSKRLVVKDLRRYIPKIQVTDVERSMSGVRAQPVNNSGAFVNDFTFEIGCKEGPERDISQRVLHCRTAPSPAATSSMAIACHLADMVQTEFLEKRRLTPAPPATT